MHRCIPHACATQRGKSVLGKRLAERLDLPKEWTLGRVLPGQREGATQWFQGEVMV